MPIHAFKGVIPTIASDCFIAPDATVIGDVEIKAGSSVWFQTVLRGDTAPIRIGSGSNIQDLTMLHADPGCDLVIGDRVTVGHRAIVHGCTVEDDCLVGMGAIVMNGAVIGRGSIVAAGAVVLENMVVPPPVSCCRNPWNDPQDLR